MDQKKSAKRYTAHVTTFGAVVLTDAATRATRTFWCPESGGYVREVTPERPGTLGAQVCDGLRHTGSTLRSTRDGLLGLIRREARVAYARHAEEARSWA